MTVDIIRAYALKTIFIEKLIIFRIAYNKVKKDDCTIEIKHIMDELNTKFD